MSGAPREGRDARVVSREGRYAHVVSLDGLRFAAAAIVLVGHCFNVFAVPRDVAGAIRASPLAILINGYGAVQLFFVLSGFCLAGSAARCRGLLDLLQFYVRRVLRIHPPYVFALAVAWLASFAYDASRGAGALSPYLIERASVHLPLRELLPYFLYPSAAAMQLGPAWTLFVEMNFSFLLPPMMWVARRAHWSALLLLSLYPLYGPTPLPSFLDYAFHFSLGIAVYQERARLERWLDRLPRIAGALLGLAGLTAFAAPVAFGFVYEPGFVYAASGLVVSGIGGALLLLAALYLPAVHDALASRPLAWGGRISYSFYLLHYPIMILWTRSIAAPLGWGEGLAFLAVVFASTTAAAALGFRLVEQPSIRLGNTLCRALARRTAAEPQFSRLAR